MSFDYKFYSVNNRLTKELRTFIKIIYCFFEFSFVENFYSISPTAIVEKEFNRIVETQLNKQ